MAQSGFEDKRGLAYPPNVEPNLEPWMERVRVTLGKLLNAAVDAARINSVTLDVDEAGNVTAQISPNENTKWIEHYGLVSDYPTIAQIVTSGTEVRVWDTPGETHTTGTLITLTDGQTYFFGAVAYEEEEADLENPALSTSVPVYAEITYAESGSDPGPDTIIPTVEEVVTVDGPPATVGTVTLTIIDPDTYVTEVGFRTWTGGAWNSWVDDVSFPFDNSENVTMQEQHNVGIEWKVLYDLGGGRGVETISNVVMFDIDSNPELTEGYLTVDTTDGDVIYFYVGDDDTASVKYATKDSPDWTLDSLAKTAAEGGTLIDGRTGPDTGGTVVHSALAEGATKYVAVVPNDTTGATGVFGSQVYRYQITRPSDTTDDTIPPMVEGDVTYDGAGNATLVLEIDWGTYSTGTVQFKAKSGSSNWDVSWTTDPPPTPYSHSVALDEKHDSHIKYLLTYGGGLTLGDVVTIDVDRIPELQTAYISVSNAGDATLVWAGDDDVDYIKWKVATGADPVSYPAWTGPTDGGTRDPPDPPADNARNGEIVITTGMTEGQGVAASFYMFRSTGENSLIVYEVRNSYRTDTDTDTDLPPTVIETSSESGAVGTLQLDAVDPQGGNLEIKFWTRIGHADKVGPDTRSGLGAPVSETDTVALEEKKTSTIQYEVSNAAFTVGGLVPFDTDRIPDVTATLDIMTDGTVQLSWVGDSDLESIRYHYAISNKADVKHFADVTDPTSTGNDEDGRTGSAIILEDSSSDEVIVAQGESIYVKVRGFTEIEGAGDYGELVQIPMTRPIDTTASSNLVANGDFESVGDFWGGLRYYGSNPYYTLWSVTTGGGGIDGESLIMLGDSNYAVNVYTSTNSHAGAFYNNETISCAAADRIDVSADAYVTVGTHTLTMYVLWYDSSKSQIGADTNILEWSELVATPKSTSLVAPTNASYCGFRFHIPIDATDSKNAYVDNVVAQFRVAFSDHPVSDMGDVATYSTSTGDVLTWTDTAGGQWDAVAPDTGVPSHDLVDHDDVNSGAQDTDLLYRNGLNWEGRTRIELGLMTNLSVMFEGVLEGSHQKINFIEGDGVTILGANNDPSNRVDITISVDPAGNISSGGSNTGDYDIVIDSDSGGSNVFRVKNSAQSLMTVNETGDLNCIGDVQAQNVYATDNFELGGTSGSPECTIVSNTAYLQLDANGYLWCVDGDVRIGPSATGDMKINEPTAGKWTIYAPGSNTATGNGLYLDDGGTNNAKVVSIKAITTSGTAPTGDYPYGTLHLIY